MNRAAHNLANKGIYFTDQGTAVEEMIHGVTVFDSYEANVEGNLLLLTSRE
jgi:hypothetical protein